MSPQRNYVVIAILALAGLTAACGSSDDGGGGAAGAAGAAGDSTDAGADSPADSLDELFSLPDAPSDVVTTTFDSSVVAADAGLFDCGGCACDGTTHYCAQASGGHVLPPADAAACPEPDGGSGFGCQPLPAACGGVPTCGCLPQTSDACSCEDVGGGLQVMCVYP